MSGAHDDIGPGEIYRELASEKTPPELDRQVLAMAARGGRTRHGRARAWIRPVAWAATIVLGVAAVLEVTRNADGTDESVSEEFAAGEMNLLREADERARLRASEAREQAGFCDGEDRKAADSWYDCIETLRHEGSADAAQAELEMLRHAFPDFPVPDAE